MLKLWQNCCSWPTAFGRRERGLINSSFHCWNLLGSIDRAPYLGFENKILKSATVCCFPGTEVPPNHGGLEITIRALDKYTAQDEFLREVARLKTRTVAASRKRRLVFRSTARMAPGSGTIPLDHQPEILFVVPALDQDGGRTLFSPVSPEVDSALDMLVALNSEHDRTACVNAWAALESLFAGPGDFGNFAEVTHRAAAILTCSYLHREISGLGHAHQRKASDVLASQLGELEGSAWLSAVINYAKSGETLEDDRELAAINQARVERLVRDPRNIDDLRLGIAGALSRLYRTRNTIVHNGEFAPYGLAAVVAAARALLSGLLDRVVVRSREDKLDASLIAAKAELVLARILQGDDLALVEGL